MGSRWNLIYYWRCVLRLTSVQCAVRSGMLSKYRDVISTPPDLLPQDCSVPIPDQDCSVPITDQDCSVPITDQDCSVPLTDQDCSVPITDQECSVPIPDQDCSVPIPDQDCSVPITSDEPQAKFSDKSQFAFCSCCQQKVQTNISSEISCSGWTFAIICCLLGSCILSCLVPCFPGFRKYTHSCPECRAILAQAEPKHSTIQLLTLVLTTVGVLGLALLILILCVTP